MVKALDKVAMPKLPFMILENLRKTHDKPLDFLGGHSWYIAFWDNPR